MTDFGHREGHRVDHREHVEVEETIVERAYQRVCDRMGKPHQVTVVGRRIDHQEMAMLHCSNHFVEIGELGSFVFVKLGAFDASDAEMDRQLEIDMGPLGPGTAVLKVVSEALLPAVEIDRGHALAGFHQRDRDMHRDRGFPRASLLVSHHDHVW